MPRARSEQSQSGLRLIKDYLPRAYRDGSDIEARSRMLAAASMGATAFQKGLGAVHSISHPIGALFDTHHGLTNGVVLPYVMTFNREAIEERFKVPVFAYQVSGEYAMIEAAVAVGAAERDAMVLETLIAFRRAGCSGVLTYHAAYAARLLRG